MLKTARWASIFIHLDKTPERDGRTDRRKDRRKDRQIFRVITGGVHCEQCGRAVKINGKNNNNNNSLHSFLIRFLPSDVIEIVVHIMTILSGLQTTERIIKPFCITLKRHHSSCLILTSNIEAKFRRNCH